MNNMFFGVVEDRISDPLKLGRCKVRIVGIHGEDKNELPTADLPWAIVLQPTHSAANSGVGHSPTGILQGTWVAIVFRDEYNQHPIIIGTLPGIPTKDTKVEDTKVIRSGDGSVWTDGSGEPITSGEKEVAAKKEEVEPPNEFSKPGLMRASPAAYNLIKSVEGLASLSMNPGKKPKIGNNNTPFDTVLYSYIDTGNKWTIGWGTTTAAGVSPPITQTTTITRKEADAYLEASVTKTCEASIRRNVKVPLTQSMYDSIVSMIYNMGSVGFASTDVAKSLNAGDYKAAAAHIPGAKNNGGSLISRRNKEKSLFLKDGIPQDDGKVKKIPTEEERVVDATQNPAVKKDKSFYPDSKIVEQKTVPGFEDPSGIYPKYIGEPDTHRLARGERIDGTVVFKKEAARARGVTTANGSSWSQPLIPYNASYPYNSVFASESGHLQEFDDTPGSERYHLYHKEGTFVEIDKNGTMVRRIVGDDFNILERNGNILIRGNCNLTVVGDANIRVENNATIESLGTMDIKAGGDIGIGSNGNIRVSADGQFSVDASEIHWNSGMGGGVKKSGGGASGGVSFNDLHVPNRTSVEEASYETPEEGVTTDKTEELDKVKVEPKPETVEKMEEKPVVEDPPAGCDGISKEGKFAPSYRLTPNFTVEQLFTGSSGIPSGINFGLTANEIICNVKQLAENCLEHIKKRYPNMIISNTWRSEKVNAKVGGVDKSDHLFGYAADIRFSKFSRKQHYEAVQEIYKMLPSFHQLILEYKNGDTWIHVSYSTKKGNKKQALTINAAIGKPLSRDSYILA